jgi:ankyrin repeat protein
MKKTLAIAFCLLGAFRGVGPAMAGVAEDRLAQAVREDDHGAIKALLAGHADPNALLPDQSTVLSWAIDRQDEESVKLLLAAGARPNVRDPEGFTPITLACELGNPAIVVNLLKAGADARTVRPDGVAALELCAGTTTPQVVGAMLAKGAKVNFADLRGQTPLMWAADKGQTANIAFLLAHGAQVNAVSKKGFTPLFFAIQSKVPAASLLLLNAGADPKAQLPDGTSVIQAAVLENNIPFAMEVVSRGSDLAAHDKEGRQLIHVAAASGSADFVKLVVAKGADVNVMSQPPPAPPTPNFRQVVAAANQPTAGGAPGAGGTPGGATPGKPRLARADGSSGPPPPPPVSMPPLLYAAKAGSAEAMKTLVDAGAKPDLKAKDGTTVALAAAAGGNLAAMQYALQIDPNINAKADGGKGILHIAAANAGAPEGEAVIQYLVDKGAKLDAKDDRGRMPGDSVPENKHEFFNALLKQHGIEVNVLGPADADADNVDLGAELATASTHAGLAAKATTIDMVRMHMHHAINCLVGPTGAGFDAGNANPCAKDGMGAIPDVTDAAQKKKLQDAADQLKAGLALTDIVAAGKVATAASAEIAAAK